jgi:hypothetical protein
MMGGEAKSDQRFPHYHICILFSNMHMKLSIKNRYEFEFKVIFGLQNMAVTSWRVVPRAPWGRTHAHQGGSCVAAEQKVTREVYLYSHARLRTTWHGLCQASCRCYSVSQHPARQCGKAGVLNTTYCMSSDAAAMQGLSQGEGHHA